MPSSDIDLLTRNLENRQGLLDALRDDPPDREPGSFRGNKVVCLPAFAISLVQIPLFCTMLLNP